MDSQPSFFYDLTFYSHIKHDIMSPIKQHFAVICAHEHAHDAFNHLFLMSLFVQIQSSLKNIVVHRAW